MPQIIDPQRWEQLKNIIRSKYITKGHQLEGPDGLIKFMEGQHGLKAT
jgi:hypothetical protein